MMEAQSEKDVPFFIRITQFKLFHHIKSISIMPEETSKELDRRLKEEGHERDKNDPNRYDNTKTGEKVWTNGDYSRTENDSTYRKNQ